MTNLEIFNMGYLRALEKIYEAMADEYTHDEEYLARLEYEITKLKSTLNGIEDADEKQ